jgi:hypothetical protein
MRRSMIVLATAAGIALTTGCANTPQRVEGEAIPVGAASPVPSATRAVTTSPPVSSSPSLSPPASAGTPKSSTTSKKPSQPKVTRVIGPANVLGPTGLGKLQIGMTKKEAEATGMVEAGEGDQHCGSWYLKPDTNGDAGVSWSSRGVVSIAAYDRIATPEGIRIGSTLAQTEKAYEDLSGVATEKNGGSWGDGAALAGENDKYSNVHYRFFFVNGAVTKLKLEHDQPGCS